MLCHIYAVFRVIPEQLPVKPDIANAPTAFRVYVNAEVLTIHANPAGWVKPSAVPQHCSEPPTIY